MEDYFFEIDFLPVGNGDKSGDAIALRYGFPGNFQVMVVDGGTKESGQALVNHIRDFYGVEHVDFVVNTHPDLDHASGLSVVLEQLTVGELWMHRPWNYSEELCNLFQDGRITPNSLTDRMKDKMKAAYRLEELAAEKSIPVFEPYQGATIGAFWVLSPSKEWYLELVPEFNKTPEAKRAEQSLLEKAYVFVGRAAQAIFSIFESWDHETLTRDPEGTSADNNSSVILYGNLGGRGLLLTGDAGVEALEHASDYAELAGFNLPACRFYQVPHHGSRRNVSPEVLERLVGPKLPEGSAFNATAFVSASQDSSQHPRRVVTNAFQRRGAQVIVTRGKSMRHYHNAPERAGWITAEKEPFHDYVEE